MSLRLASVVWVPVLFAVALGVRLGQHHAALLYPDGYQYLLMARGISEHLQPTTELGPGGEVFVPSADAAMKPLFPLMVAAGHGVGLSWLDAARLLTVIAGAVAVVALALLVVRLSGSRSAGIAAGALLLTSPSVAFWSGFSGPDPLAQALVLCAALALSYRRPVAGGILAGLAITARPEVALLALAAAIVSLRSPSARRDLARAAPAAGLTASAVLVLVRTPVELPDARFLWLAPLGLLGAVLATVAPIRLVRHAAPVGAAAVAVAVATQDGPAELWQRDWALLVLGAAGFLILLRGEGRDATALVVLGAVLVLGAVYVLKNPTLVRYFSLLLPAAALLAGVAVSSLPTRARPAALAGLALAVVFALSSQVPGSRDHDMFALVAGRVAPKLDSTALLTAAPDAYGFWLPDHAVRGMTPGARGAVLLDAAQRLYKPELGAAGSVVARVTDEVAFARPNGDIDAGPALLVAGRVVERRSTGADAVP